MSKTYSSACMYVKTKKEYKSQSSLSSSSSSTSSQSDLNAHKSGASLFISIRLFARLPFFQQLWADRHYLRTQNKNEEDMALIIEILKNLRENLFKIMHSLSSMSHYILDQRE
uniref:Uncharacterized protein n=1 Tax=Glossina palpalis gambiensis TaxID=67801 RepID=A0A1B0ANV0_9MUSC